MNSQNNNTHKDTGIEPSSNINLICAVDQYYGISKNDRIPWDIPEDLKFFKNITNNSTLIMGWNTWESLPQNTFVSSNRTMIVVTSKTIVSHQENLIFVNNIDTALEFSKASQHNSVFFIGGTNIYKESLKYINKFYVTHIHSDYNCDNHIKWLASDLDLCSHKKILHSNSEFDIIEYHNNRDEEKYLNLLRDCLTYGSMVNDRTNVGVLSTFGKCISFNLKTGFPLLTTKKMFFRGIVEELLWIINGSTNGQELLNKNVRIWEQNGSRDYLDSIGLCDNIEHDLGPVYGHQWRHWNAIYIDASTDYTGIGIDQLKNLISGLKEDPHSRRHILSAWNPEQINQMALPPCHCMVQFYVSELGLCCQMYQRSADLFLGLPFNIASYSLLTHMIAQVCELNVDKINICIGDAHIYKNHIDQVKMQLKNNIMKLPKLQLNKDIDNIDDFTVDDIKIVDYQSHLKISAPMAT